MSNVVTNPARVGDIAPTSGRAGGAAPATRTPVVLAWAKEHSKLVYGTLGIVVLLGAWQLTADAGLVNISISSDPLLIARTEGHLFATGQIWAPIGVTASEVGWGLLVSLVVGIPLGLVLGRVRPFYDMCEPIINVLNAVPYVLFLPIIIFWFGIGTESILVLVIWGAVMPLLINTSAGVRNLNRDYLRVAEVFTTGRFLFYRSVLFPATLPYILTGVRLAIARALVGAIVAEFFLSSHGIGYFVQKASTNFDMNSAMSGIVIVAVVAIVLTKLVGWAERRYTHWSQG